MADQEAAAQVLSCGRDPAGRFFVIVGVPAQIGTKQVVVPIHTFILTKDEERAWHASLSGIIVAAAPPNGRVLN